MATGGVVIEPKSTAAAASAVEVPHGHWTWTARASSGSGGPWRRRGQTATTTGPTGGRLLGPGPGRRTNGHLLVVLRLLIVTAGGVRVGIAVATASRDEPHVAGVVLALGPGAADHDIAILLALSDILIRPT